MSEAAPSHEDARSPDYLRRRAREIIAENGFEPTFPEAARAELERLDADAAAALSDDRVRDLRALPWSSIDNPESRDLDQIEMCEDAGDEAIRLRLGIADVDHLVPRGSALDLHAAHNTTSVYTGVEVFPMLPEKLSTDLTSLNEGEERLAVVVDLVIDAGGETRDATAYQARVINHAKLAYDAVSAWLGGSAPIPAEVAAVEGLPEQLRLQDTLARRLRARRQERGALDLETIEARPVTANGRIVDLQVTRKGLARDLIEDFMIAANVAMASFLERRRVPSIRRVVTVPRRWSRIVQVVERHGGTLPDEPDSRALSAFLRERRAADPDGFADLSLSIVKLLGAGHYVVERPWEPDGEEGHFGLAVDDYSHTTAPNRRYADLVMQRLLKATIAGAAPPYTAAELDTIAERCTAMEDAARKVERAMRKVAAAVLLERRVGERFDAIVTGVNRSGTFARLVQPPAEGRVVRGEEGVDVGDRIRVTLVGVDVEKGHIDFARGTG